MRKNVKSLLLIGKGDVFVLKSDGRLYMSLDYCTDGHMCFCFDDNTLYRIIKDKDGNYPDVYFVEWQLNWRYSKRADKFFHEREIKEIHRIRWGKVGRKQIS